ncbi:hypothetical protein QYE76_009281 [Lolium multiflorum]|uniref:Uncharacterized protein n=1 Tax=Lolium multiflorum TaxID=4521 RepID=A0AAD8X3F7_LOLMU|nr:hypothetical protein QYE76_009281 [Lolium multiflorum]
MAVCTVKVWMTAKQLVAVAELEVAWINGDFSRASAAPGLRLALLRRRLRWLTVRGEVVKGDAIGGDSLVGEGLVGSHCFRACRGSGGIFFPVYGGGGPGSPFCACLVESWWRGEANGEGKGAREGGMARRRVSVARASADKDGMAMPLLSHVGVAGAFWPGRCGPPLDDRRSPACSGDQGEHIGHGGRGHGGEKRGEGEAHGHGRHGGGLSIHGPPLGLLLGVLERRAAANPISGDSEIASGTLPERGFISGGLYTAMVASGVMSV